MENKVSIEKIKYFSQFGEDYLLWLFFNRKENGFFVEVGAFDGRYISTTYSFAQQGWTGICIEPNPVFFELLNENRKESKCLNYACVGEENLSEISLNIDQTGLLSSLKDGSKLENEIKINLERQNISYNGINKVIVPSRTLNSIFDEFVPEKLNIDFISIDVEGVELEVLKGLDFERYRPNILIIENNDYKNSAKVKEYLDYYNYTLAKRLGVNDIYVSNYEDFEVIKNIPVTCGIEKQVHPINPDFSIPNIRNGHVICEKLTEEIISLKEKNREFERIVKKINDKNVELWQEMKKRRERIESLESEISKIQGKPSDL